ncbi:MAG: hypothetical protein H7282_07340 [Cytophagaceae bacterium]|nr:hypothetical protein [Cytophagaceae bacterium]
MAKGSGEKYRTRKKTREVKKEVNAQQVALFITTGYAGVRNLGKLFGAACYSIYLKELKNYLDGLKTV